MGSMFAYITFFASQSLHKAAITRVMHAPMSFFETTPLGRIMNRFSKDIDTIDNLLGDSLRMFASTASSIIGAIILISIVLPWFLIGVVCIIILYAWAAAFYRASAPTRCCLTIIVILALLGNFGWLVRQVADVENNMNSVERVVHYAKAIEQEAPHESPDEKLPLKWPEQGRVELTDVVLRYRPELPAVLKGVSMNVAAGEKIGIVGRTGAGKTSIMTALYRLVELTEGSIIIDGIDISKVGLRDLRSRLAIIPQDPVSIRVLALYNSAYALLYFSFYVNLLPRTLRTNLDPFGLHDDAKLWDALKRSYLVENASLKHGSKHDPQLDAEDVSSGDHTSRDRFTLDSVIEDEGGNLSIGQRSLVSLARALVKDSKVIILDEATGIYFYIYWFDQSVLMPDIV
ncbi:hypothetical protein C0993_001289 [Termitomyces sp. T159_Od127]|nr:hypothetical protein C0993_001289 [Termitomyces sp. T159_Od127]